MNSNELVSGSHISEEVTPETLIEAILLELKLDMQTQLLDPLLLDQLMLCLPVWNENSSTDHILNAVKKLDLQNSVLDKFSQVEARAALRDLGFIAASLKRNGIEVSSVPKIEEALIFLGHKVQEIPRDTVYSYGPRNPSGDRQRHFTTTKEETIFISSFVEGMSSMYAGCVALFSTNSICSTSEEFKSSIEKAQAAFDKMIIAIRDVRSAIKPDVFTHKLRPYFDPLIIQGISYTAPGGAQMPVILFDQLIWGSDISDKCYLDYKIDNIRFSPSSIRKLSIELDGKESIVSRLEREADINTTQPLRDSASSVLSLLDSLLRFRAPHLRIAKENFAIRSNGAVGSGGYSIEILEYLIQKTNLARERLKAIINRYE